MAFKVVFLAHAPDANAEKHKCIIDTGKYKLFVVVVKNQVLLCPGFTHRDVAEIAKAVGENVGVFVARGDGPSHRVSIEVMRREGWF